MLAFGWLGSQLIASLCCIQGHMEALKVLAAHGARFDTEGNNGTTPLSIAVKNNNQVRSAVWLSGCLVVWLSGCLIVLCSEASH